MARPGLKESVIDDITDYLSPETQSWYSDCGIPWRRGYLFSGPPGTGKTSFSLALAGYFNLRIYTLSLTSENATEESLAELFSKLPRFCIVLLEDIDAAGLTSTRAASESDGKNNSSSEEGRVSLSGLLNILDGTSSQEGRILIMTTNHAEHLDKALLRPGRIDMTVNFTLSDRAVSAAIFRNIFSNLCNEVTSQGAAGRTCKAPRRTSSEIEDLSEAFAAKIPPGEFSTAELQGYLLHHRGKPEAAVAGAEDWARGTILDRRKDVKSVVIAPRSSPEDVDPEDIDRPKDIGRPRKDSGKDMTLEKILGR